MAEQAPICKGNLCRYFGYLAFSPTVRAILNRTYDFPEEFVLPTRELLETCAMIRVQVPANSKKHNHMLAGMAKEVGTSQGRHFLVRIRTALRPLQGRSAIPDDLAPPCFEGNYNAETRLCDRYMVLRTISHVGEDVWLHPG